MAMLKTTPDGGVTISLMPKEVKRFADAVALAVVVQDGVLARLCEAGEPTDDDARRTISAIRAEGPALQDLFNLLQGPR